jgi:hypothetical protein
MYMAQSSHTSDIKRAGAKPGVYLSGVTVSGKTLLNRLKEMEMAISVLLKCWIGAIMSLLFAGIGNAVQNPWVGYLAMAASAVTLGYTLYKWGRDIKKDIFTKRVIKRRKRVNKTSN